MSRSAGKNEYEYDGDLFVDGNSKLVLECGRVKGGRLHKTREVQKVKSPAATTAKAN